MAEVEGAQPTIVTVERDEKGRWKPGTGSPNPNGDRKLPDWLKGDVDALLKLQRLAAFKGVLPFPKDPNDPEGEMTFVVVEAKHRMLAIESLINRTLGKPRTADDGDKDKRDEVIDMLAQIVTMAAPPKAKVIK